MIVFWLLFVCLLCVGACAHWNRDVLAQGEEKLELWPRQINSELFGHASATVAAFQISSILHSLLHAQQARSKLCWAEPIWRVPMITETLKPPRHVKAESMWRYLTNYDKL